jgi:Ca2+-binding EF-hand superfamily protein
MTRHRHNGLLAALLMTGAFVASTALAQLGQPRQPPLPGEAPDSARGHFADRFLAEFDLNHDGKVPRDEFNKAVAKEFYSGSGGAQTMSQDQFIALRTRDLKQRVTELFHRSDWNGDGKLSFDEFAAPERSRFEQLDRDGTGVVQCSARASFADEEPSRGGNEPPAPAQYASRRGGTRGTGGSRGRGAFCADNDLNRDGHVTHAELDQSLHQQFQAAAKGGQFLSLDQLYALELARYREIDARIFQRINTSYNGKLTLQEYSASEAKFFARLDKNGDGVITEDELASRRRNPPGTARVAKAGR